MPIHRPNLSSPIRLATAAKGAERGAPGIQAFVGGNLIDGTGRPAVKDAVEIEKELAKVTEVIEQIEGRLKVMRDKVGYSSITVSFQANAPSPVRTTAILPFTWLDTMGLEPLLNVPKVSP